MPTLNPSLVLIGPFPPQLRSLGAEIYSDLQAARNGFENSACEVLAISLTTLRESRFETTWKKIQNSKKQTQIILICPDSYRSKDVIELYEKYPIFRWRTSFENGDIVRDLHQALERSRHLQQQETLNHLLDQETKDLETFQTELENRVEKRTKFLVESRRKLFLMNSRMEEFRGLLIDFQQATSQQELEEILNKALSRRMEVQWIRLLVGQEEGDIQKNMSEALNYETLCLPLYHGDHRLGSLLFMKSKPKTFAKEDVDFLRQVSEIVALALERLTKASELRSLKAQWDSTFQAIADPILLIDSNYSVLQSNRSNGKAQQQTCYELLFNRSTPCVDCHRGENFSLNQGGETFSVTSQTVGSSYLNLYHNRTQELRMEAQILETARTAELGTIGSSIAHELNNPLGGLLTFVQMIAQELPKDSLWVADIQEMERGAQRCREIIQNLLIFSRVQDLQSESIFDINELTQQILKISEIHAKTLNVNLDWTGGDLLPLVRGNPSLTSQALRNLLQIGIDHASNRTLVLKTRSLPSQLEWRLDIPDLVNAKNLDKENFSWSLARQILLDQGASLTVLSESEGTGCSLRILFTRLVFRS
ncbi:MAG: hypothetical protein JNM39_13035 [Bdellovibrionaceae bacterium]|nr:hypothetical protein [Pseudobdellovibrionaceae bacterium]